MTNENKSDESAIDRHINTLQAIHDEAECLEKELRWLNERPESKQENNYKDEILKELKEVIEKSQIAKLPIPILLNKLREFRVLALIAIRKLIAQENGIPLEMADRLAGNSPTEIEADAKKFHDLYLPGK